MRVLFVSDVYFPRVNGVSTSVWTFRLTLRPATSRLCWSRPTTGVASAAPRPGVVRVAAAGVPGDPEDRRMRWGALNAALRAAPGILRPRAHPYAISRPLCRRALRTALEDSLHRDLSHLLRGVSASLRAGAAPPDRARSCARRFTRSQCRDVAALIAPSEPMRAVLLEYGVHDARAGHSHGASAHRFDPGNGARFRAAQGLPADRPLVLYIGRVAHEKNIEFLLHVFAQVRAARAERALRHRRRRPGPRSPCVSSPQRLGLARGHALRRLP